MRLPPHGLSAGRASPASRLLPFFRRTFPADSRCPSPSSRVTAPGTRARSCARRCSPRRSPAARWRAPAGSSTGTSRRAAATTAGSSPSSAATSTAVPSSTRPSSSSSAPLTSMPTAVWASVSAPRSYGTPTPRLRDGRDPGEGRGAARGLRGQRGRTFRGALGRPGRTWSGATPPGRLLAGRGRRTVPARPGTGQPPCTPRRAEDTFTSMVSHQLGSLGLAVTVPCCEETGEVHALRGHRFASMQFHAESLLTQDGVRVVQGLLKGVLQDWDPRHSRSQHGYGGPCGQACPVRPGAATARAPPSVHDRRARH